MEGEEQEEDEDDEELPDVEALDYDDLNSVAKLQASHRFQHLMEVRQVVMRDCIARHGAVLPMPTTLMLFISR